MKRIYILLTGITLSSLLFTSCGGGEEKQGADDTDTTENEDPNMKEKIEHTKKLVYSVPSPSEMATILQNAGATYNYKLLNDPKNADKYSTLQSRSLSLGVYGADLNYANIFDNTQETMFYIQCTQKLANALGIENAVNEQTVTRAQDNVDNKDSMLKIIPEMFWELHDYLHDNDKMDITAFVVVGGYVEGLYLATQTVNDTKPNMEIVQKVGEQKLTLDHLISLLNTYEKNKNIEKLLTDMNRVKAVFDKVEMTKEKSTVTEENGTTVIGGGPKITITMEVFKEIKTLIGELRDEYVSTN